MAVLRSPPFIICLVLFIVHQIITKGMNIQLGWIDNYLDSFLAMPVILTLWLAERRWLFKQGSSYLLPLLHVVMATLYISLVSEMVFPLLSRRFTADWRDVVCYAVGSILFYFTVNRPATHRVSKIAGK
jgi:hypothetical protein